MSFLKYRLLEIAAVVDNTGHSIANTSTFCSIYSNDTVKDLANATVLLQGLVWGIVSQRRDLIHHVFLI